MADRKRLSAAELKLLSQDMLAAASARDQARQMQLYRCAGEHFLAMEDIEQACYFMTNAWVLALAIGDPAVEELHQLLAEHGRVPL